MKPQLEPPAFTTGPLESIAEPPTELVSTLEADQSISWQEMVRRLVKKPREIMAQMTSDKATQLAIATHCALIATDAVDAAKKRCVYNKQQPHNTFRDVFSPTAESFLEMTDEQASLLHAAIGMFGEAGEILENVLRHIGGAPLDKENSVEESGDLDFYHEDYRRVVGFSQEAARLANMKKLGKRYPGFVYSDASAAAHADKAGDAHTSPRSTSDFPGASL